MSAIRLSPRTVLAALILAALAGCSKPAQTPSASDATTASTAAPTSGTSAPASVSPVKLDIKDAAGNPVSGDPVSGKQVFMQCMTCHSKDAGVNRVGPSLHGIIGRHSGSVAGFNYSSANKNSGIVWTEQELYTYLENPQKTIPGTYMTYTGVKDPHKRADIIAYLQENTK